MPTGKPCMPACDLDFLKVFLLPPNAARSKADARPDGRCKVREKSGKSQGKVREQSA